MSDEQKAREDEVFGQELSTDDLDAAAGGDCGGFARAFGDYGDHDRVFCQLLAENNCTNDHLRPIYWEGHFPNCAATVEDGSHCGTNDACHDGAVVYARTTECSKAWR